MIKVNILFILLVVTGIQAFAQQKISNGSLVPVFSVADVNGVIITEDSFAGKKILLSFTRNAGCPVCNSYVHQLLEYADSFRLSGIEVFIVSQSPSASLKEYILNENLPFRFISDSADYLYKIFAVEKSMWKELMSVFHGSLKKRKQGMRQYKHKPKFEGSLKMVGADFLIGKNHKITRAFYGKYVGDRMSAQMILHLFIN